MQSDLASIVATLVFGGALIVASAVIVLTIARGWHRITEALDGAPACETNEQRRWRRVHLDADRRVGLPR